MTLLDYTAILTAVIAAAVAGAVSNVITLRVGVSRLEARQELSNKALQEKLAAYEERVNEGFETFHDVAEKLEDSVTRLMDTVSRHAVYLEINSDHANRLRAVEQEVVVLKAKIS